MNQWHFFVNGQKVGPMDLVAAMDFAKKNPEALCWRPGFAEWIRVSHVAELSGAGSAPPPAAPVSGGPRGTADEIDFKIFGSDMQFVEVELDPGESAISEAGAIDASDIDVQVSQGEVTLAGTVPARAQRRAGTVPANVTSP